EHLDNFSVPSDDVVRTHRSARKGKCMERLFGGVLRSMMDDDVVGFSDIEIGGTYPTVDAQTVVQREFRDLAVLLCVGFGFFVIDFVGRRIGLGAAGR